MTNDANAKKSFMHSRYLDDYPDVLLPEECMSILAVGRNTIYALLKNGEIPSLRIGKQYRIPKVHLQRYLECVK